MIELTWEQIANTPFQQAVVAVNNARDLDAKTVYRAGRICQVARKEAEKIAKVRVTLAEKHGYEAVKDAFPSTDAETAFKAELDQQLAETKVEIKVHKLDWKDIFGKVKLTGLELVHLQAVCDNVPG
jgi:4-hydroxyphenylpyruvate dioxygenase-like putative hemolysin